MRIKIHCRLTSRERTIGYNYNNALSAIIYNMMHSFDPTFSKTLHDGTGFKRFTFSPIEFDKADFRRDGNIFLKEKSFSFIVSTSQPKIREAIANMEQKEYQLCTDNGSITFEVVNIVEGVVSLNNNIFELASPIAINKKVNKKEIFLAPNDSEYNQLFFKNLIRKAGKTGSDYDISKFNLEIIGPNPKKRFQNYVIGYKYIFRITCPKELIEVGVLEGFGVKNSQGFGYVN